VLGGVGDGRMHERRLLGRRQARKRKRVGDAIFETMMAVERERAFEGRATRPGRAQGGRQNERRGYERTPQPRSRLRRRQRQRLHRAER
jgi:hypothetical protein